MPNFTKNKLRWFWIAPVLMVFHLISFGFMYELDSPKFYALIAALVLWCILLTIYCYDEGENWRNVLANGLLNTAFPLFLGLFLLHIPENTSENIIQMSGFSLGVVLMFQVSVLKTRNWMPTFLTGRVHNDTELRKWVTFLFQKECQKNDFPFFNVIFSLGTSNVLALYPDDETTIHHMICKNVARLVNQQMAGDEWPVEWDCMKVNTGCLIDTFEKDKLQALQPHLFQLFKAPFTAHELLSYHQHFERQTK